jgi:hypothetical protein
MENVYFDLDLEQNYGHPQVEGWMSVFKNWVKRPVFDEVWTKSKNTYNRRFQGFYEDRLKNGS